MYHFVNKDGEKFTLFSDVWKHILAGHPEIDGHLKEIKETLFKPIVICRSKKFRKRHLYYSNFKSRLFFVVVIDAAKRIIKTSYITDRIKGGEIIWQEKK